MIAAAPGKVILAGEYAVLAGAPAVVMAVDRVARAEVQRVVAGGERPGTQPEVEATLACARERGLLAGAPAVRVDTTDLARGGRKLGLGSSAAGCVAALGAAVAAEGGDVAALRAAIADAARAGHQRAQGGGSGLDVLASALGGVLQVTLPDGPAGAARTEALRWPAHVPWGVLWTGVPVRTSDRLRAVRGLGERDPAALAAALGRIEAATAAFITALRAGAADGVVQAVAVHFEAMDGLGAAAGMEVVTPGMHALRAGAEALGAAIKPSGAGGGDIVLAVARDRPALEAVFASGVALGFVPLDLRVDALGVRVEEPVRPVALRG